MDFMRALLIYMTAAFGLAVQNTAAPAAIPEPEITPPPAVVEQVNGQSAPTMQIINGITPTPSITPEPVPTITPNSAYHNLAMGARGSDVKKLQQRLVELGYLPEDAVDGAYGRQTYHAVRRFQYYNGLSQDGIAGKRTQTYLYENPDAAPYPTPTAEPTVTPTAEPTEAPTAEPTAEPTVTPTAEPTEAPTAEPTEAPTAEPTAEPTEAPTAEPTEAPTKEPTAESTEAPAAEPTAEPAETVTEAPEEIIEEVDLDAGLFVEIEGSIAYNEGGEPLSWIGMRNGVPAEMKPRLQENDGRIRVSLDDLVRCVPGWALTDDGTVVLEAEGHTLGIYNEKTGIAATIDGTEIRIEPADFDFGNDGHFISASFLANALMGTAEWDAEERTLMLRIPVASETTD